MAEKSNNLGGEVNISGSAKMSVRSNLSVWHILTAAHFARKAGEIERSNIDKPFGDFYEIIASYVMGSVFFSVAALEGSINELFVDAVTTIPEQSHELTQAIWANLEQKASILDKYDLALLLKGKAPVDRGIETYQNASILISLRNALVHFKPEWDNENAKHKKLSERLQHKFALSPFLEEGNALFPKRCMSHGCASWSTNTAIKFMTFFCGLAGQKDRFASFHHRLITT